MTVFSRRPAALAAALCIPLSFAAAYLGFSGRLALILIVTALSSAAAVKLKESGLRVATMRAFSFVLIAGTMALLQLLTAVALYDFGIAPFERLAAREGVSGIKAVVTRVRSETDWNATYEISLTELGGERKSSAGLLLCKGSYALAIGDEIDCDVIFIELDEVYSDIGLDKYDLCADGIRFACEPVGEISHAGRRATFRTEVEELRTRIGGIADVYAGDETGAVIKALLLSDKRGLGILKRDMSRAGVSHLLALSGMHLAVICGMIEAVSKKMRLPLHFRMILQLIGALIFLIVSAFPYSLVRASVMLLLLSACRFIGRDRDPITALFLCCWLIVFADPSAIHDVGFQLSVSATLGVLITLEAEAVLRMKLGKYTHGRPVLRRIRNLIFSIFVSLGATLFVLPLQWIHFGEMSLMSVPATLIIAPMVTVMLWLIIPFAIAGLTGLSPVAFILGNGIAFFTGCMRCVAGAMSELPTLIPLRYKFVPVFIVLFIAAAFLLKRFRGTEFLSLLGVFCVFVTAYIGTVTVYEQFRARKNELWFKEYKTNDAAVVYSSGKCVAVDISDGSSALMKCVARDLPDHNVCEIDTLVLTHLHRGHAVSLKRLCYERMVRRVLIPEPSGDAEISYSTEIKRTASELGVNVVEYARAPVVSIRFGGFGMAISAGEKLKRSVHPLIGIEFDLGGGKIFYAGASYWEGGDTPVADAVVIGNHGPKVKSDPPDYGVPTMPAGGTEFRSRA